MEKIMSKATMHNSEASFDVRELKDELSEEELKNISGGKANFQDFQVVKKVDKSSPALFQ